MFGKWDFSWPTKSVHNLNLSLSSLLSDLPFLAAFTLWFAHFYTALFLAELLLTAELFKWKYFLVKSLIISQDLEVYGILIG